MKRDTLWWLGSMWFIVRPQEEVGRAGSSISSCLAGPGWTGNVIQDTDYLQHLFCLTWLQQPASATTPPAQPRPAGSSLPVLPLFLRSCPAMAPHVPYNSVHTRFCLRLLKDCKLRLCERVFVCPPGAVKTRWRTRQSSGVSPSHWPLDGPCPGCWTVVTIVRCSPGCSGLALMTGWA